jgi:hypothetical protein
MHKYEFYGNWDNCDFYWDSPIQNIDAQIKNENKTEESTINSNEIKKYANEKININFSCKDCNNKTKNVKCKLKKDNNYIKKMKINLILNKNNIYLKN